MSFLDLREALSIHATSSHDVPMLTKDKRMSFEDYLVRVEAIKAGDTTIESESNPYLIDVAARDAEGN